MQVYSAIPKNLGRQAKATLFWYLKEKADVKIIQMMLTDIQRHDKIVIVRDLLKESKHACLFIRNENLRGFKVLNDA